MKWYSGEIADAVTFSKSKGAVFVVYIEGTDEKSKKITDLINNGELGQKLEQDHFVAIKVIAGSTAHHQFSEIYKEPSVPSIYFIGKNGVPLDIITGNSNLDTVSAKVDDVLNRAGFLPAHSISASAASDNFIQHEQTAEAPRVVCDNSALNTSDESPPEDESSPSETDLEKSSEGKLAEGQPIVSETNTETVKEEKAESTKNEEVKKGEENKESKEEKQDQEKKEEDEPKIDTPVEVQKEKETTEIKDEAEGEISPEEKVRRAKELIELIRKEKQKEEEESERLKELERRKMGQNVQQMKKWQEDQELKQLKEERDREKRENQIARERVLAQIAQDRAERVSRNQASPPKAPEAPKASSPPKLDSNITRLQFKLPDGSTVTQEFEISDTLEYVVKFLRSNLQITLSSFNLATTFPRREYTSNDFSTTLLDLELVPNAVLLVLPTNGGEVSTSSQRGLISILWWGIWTPIYSVLGFIKSLVFGSGSANTTSPPPNEPARTPAVPPSGAAKRKPTDDGTTVIRRQGNIHRLSDKNDDEDDNNTWNGNSTQQM